MSKETFDSKRYNHSDNRPFSSVIDVELSRRKLLKNTVGISALSLLTSVGLFACSSSSGESDPEPKNPGNPGNPDTPDPKPKPDPEEDIKLGFESIAGTKQDSVKVAEGYTAEILAPWGMPLNSLAADWANDGSNSPADQLNAMGMHHDGMCFFPLNDSSTDGLLCVNHEYIDQDALHPQGPTVDAKTNKRTSVSEIQKEINAHGVSVIRIKLQGNRWDMVKGDPYNRRITAATEVDVAGPMKNSPWLQTRFSQNGNTVRGTLNNCGNGVTPWGTYLTCEENWPDYFINHQALTAEQKRMGIRDAVSRYNWEHLKGSSGDNNQEFSRFNATPNAASALQDYRNEAHGFGYIVEIDPYQPSSRAVKRTALGRFRHECCVYGKLEVGKPISFYSGHDSRFEYIYKFVSEAVWDPADASPTNRLVTGAKYMDKGTLYVARFDNAGKGVWLPLNLQAATKSSSTLGEHFGSMDELIVHTLKAADLVGATPMDRPEWLTVDPKSGRIYVSLTNNIKRTEDVGTNPANPRLDNQYGHVIRWSESNSVDAFSWEIFLYGAAADSDKKSNLSGLVDLNQFGSPDGLSFDQRGILWVQTDNSDNPVAEYSNNQMLAVVPFTMIDAEEKEQVVTTTNQSELRRFFVGPNGCEVTGLTFSPDHKSCFLNVQHPSNWPSDIDATRQTPKNEKLRPRSATVVIRKKDGGQIGL